MAKKENPNRVKQKSMKRFSKGACIQGGDEIIHPTGELATEEMGVILYTLFQHSMLKR